MSEKQDLARRPQEAAIQRGSQPAEMTELTRTSEDAQEKYSLQAQAALARQNPRDEELIHAKLVQLCKREGYAEEFRYLYPRSGDRDCAHVWRVTPRGIACSKCQATGVFGPSVDFAREAARLWRNLWIMSPLVIVDTPTERKIRAIVWDIESNQRREAEDCFEKLIQRKVKSDDGKTTRWFTPDERELRELTNRRAAILERNCILHLLPAAMVTACMDAVKSFLSGQAKTEVPSKAIKPEARQNILTRLAAYNVTAEHVAAFIGHKVEEMTAEEYQALLAIGKNMKDHGLTWEQVARAETDAQLIEEREPPSFDK